MVLGGKLALLRRIGEGGVGVVFEAEDTWIGRRVAVKILHSHLADRPDVLARFRREARAAAMTNHPNIVGVFEVGQTRDGAPYIVEELLDGTTLRERIGADRLTPAETVEILVPIMGALAAAHRAGIVHRDIKPENIFLARTPEGGTIPKLIDFGVAKIASSDPTTLTGSLLGTPAYMAPEQVRGDAEIDPRTDVWAVGAVMHEALSGRCPYEAGSAQAVLAKILSEPPAPLAAHARDVAPELATIVDTALARDPARRYPTMEAFLDALLGWASRPDPSIAERHRLSIPPEAAPLSIEIADTPPADDGLSARRSLPEWARPMATPELGWDDGPKPGRAPRNLEWYAAAAGQALRDNLLDEAVDHAENAVVACRATGEVLGQMRLVQAIALRWLGHYADAERAALAAAGALEMGTPGFYAAIGHVAIVSGYLGYNDRFSAIAAQLAELEDKGPVEAPHLVAAARLAVSLVRAGLVERADQVLASARRRAAEHTEEEPMVRAWIFVAAAEFAMHTGDPTGYLAHLEAAVVGFADAGDARNACLQRANIGNAYMQLGAYARAKGLLREALAVGEPMRLGFIAPVRANLGFVLARLGDVEQALEIERAALDQCIAESYRRFELASRIYLAVILSLRDDLDGAEAELRTAVEGSQSFAPIRAYALANLADILLAQGRPEEARAAAEEATALLRQLEGVEEGESLIRLTHALALEATGDAEGAAASVAEARRRLLERADRINDARLRRSFLDHIPENARTLVLAAQYKNPR
jgi:tetratricopeptide (TPR) repeat protein